MTQIGIVADDVTGGTTVGALLARVGTTPTLFYDYKRVAQVADRRNPAVIVSSNSRCMEAQEAYDSVFAATQELKKLGVTQFSKRIDTTLRGNIGAEVDAMLDALGKNHIAVIVASMPQSKKIVLDGYSLIDSTLLTDTAVVRDVRTPVHEAHIPTLLQSQFHERVEHVSLDVVKRGVTEIEAMMRTMLASYSRIFVIDAVTLDDVDTIASAVVKLGRPVVAVDPGPFTVSLAVASGAIETHDHVCQAVREECRSDDKGTVMVVAGSATGVTQIQMQRLLKEPRTVAFLADPLKLISSHPETVAEENARVVAEAVEAFTSDAQPRVAILAVDTAITGERASTREELESASGLPADEASNLLTQRLGELARLVCDVVGPQRTSGLYLTGGDTVVRVWQAIGADGIRLTDYVIPQVDQSQIVGGPFDGIPVVCKGGLTGDDITAVQAINRLFDVNRIHQTIEMEKTV